MNSRASSASSRTSTIPSRAEILRRLEGLGTLYFKYKSQLERFAQQAEARSNSYGPTWSSHSFMALLHEAFTHAGSNKASPPPFSQLMPVYERCIEVLLDDQEFRMGVVLYLRTDFAKAHSVHKPKRGRPPSS